MNERVTMGGRNSERGRVRWWLLVSVGVGVGILALLALALMDSEPPNDSDLVSFERKVAPEDNGFPIVLGLESWYAAEKASEELRKESEPEVLDPGEFDEEDLVDQEYVLEVDVDCYSETLNRTIRFRSPRFEDEDPWNEERVEEIERRADAIISRSSDALAALDVALGKPDFVIPLELTAASYVSSLSSPTTDPMDVLELLTERLRLRAARSLADRRVDDAVADSLRAVSVGRKTIGAQTPSFYRGCYGLVTSVRHASRVACATNLAPSRLRDIAAQFGDTSAITEGLLDGIRAEYGEAFATLELLGRKAGSTFRAKLMLHPNRTRQWLANRSRRLLSEAALPYEARAPSPVDAVKEGGWINSIGRMLCATAADPYGSYWNPALYAAFAVEAHRTLLAVKAFLDERGELPAKLDELIPRYLTALPVDPWNGDALQYSRSDIEIWSAGRDAPQDSVASISASDPDLLRLFIDEYIVLPQPE